MKNSIHENGLDITLKSNLISAGFNLIYEIMKIRDYCVGGHTFAVFSTQISNDTRIMNVWLIVGCNHSGYYNQDYYEDAFDAVLNHIGRCVKENKMSLNEVKNANRTNANK